MKVIHTIASTRLDHGGTSRSVPATCDALAAAGIDADLITARPAVARMAAAWTGGSGQWTERTRAAGRSQKSEA